MEQREKCGNVIGWPRIDTAPRPIAAIRYTTTSLFYQNIVETSSSIIELEDATKESLRELAYHHDWIVEELEADKDHIHIFLSAPPRYSPSDIVKLIKSWTYHHVYRKYPKIKQYLWGGNMWANGFYVSTVSDNTTKDEIARYVRNQKEQAKKQSMAQKLF